MLNIRGKDSNYTPLPNNYILINKHKEVLFFSDPKKISNKLRKKLSNIEFVDIKLVSKILSEIIGKSFLIDKSTCSTFYENLISTNNKITNLSDPIYFLKS